MMIRNQEKLFGKNKGDESEGSKIHSHQIKIGTSDSRSNTKIGSLWIIHNCRTYLVIHWTAVCGYTFSLMHRGKNVNDQ